MIRKSDAGAFDKSFKLKLAARLILTLNYRSRCYSKLLWLQSYCIFDATQDLGFIQTSLDLIIKLTE